MWKPFEQVTLRHTLVGKPIYLDKIGFGINYVCLFSKYISFGTVYVKQVGSATVWPCGKLVHLQ